MGFLKRFFSLRHKQKATRGDCRPDTAEDPCQENEGRHGGDEQAAFRSRWPKVGAKGGDDDAAISRLLRSSSTNYKVVKEADYTELPPLPHPINTVSSRSTSALTLTPTRSASVQGKGSYRVTVHKRQQLSATVFPNAYPPLTPRRPGIAHTSTPNLLATYLGSTDDVTSASTSTSALVEPRKIPFTPRDANRLSRLRQDPSVASLVKMYDDHGRLEENAFTTTPAPPRRRGVRARRSRRKSTFSELLGCHGDAEADLQWAESCIARQGELTSDNSISNTSTSSLSSTDTPPLDSPATSTFNDVDLDRVVSTPAPGLARDPSASTVTGLEKDAGFSSLVVELSVATSAGTLDSDDRPAPYLGPYRYPHHQDKGKEKGHAPERNAREQQTCETSGVIDTDSQDRTLTTKVGRKPSQRASQVFKFIAERRERRKSQELLQAPGTLNSEEDMPRARSPSPLLNLPGSSSSRMQLHAKSVARLCPDTRDFDPAPAPPSPITLRPLSPAPRPSSRNKSNSCSQATGATMLRAASNASTSTLPASLPASSTILTGKPTKGSTAGLVLLQAEREREKEKKRAQPTLWCDEQMLPATSTPHPSKIARFNSGMKVSFAPRKRDRDRAMLGEMTNSAAGAEGGQFDPASFDWKYDTFAASLDARTQQLEMQMQPRQKENTARVMTRKRGATIDLGLTRAATTAATGVPATKDAYVEAPRTPTRSQSLRGLEVGQGSLSELSPEAAAQLITDLRVRRSHARVRAERGKQSVNAV